MKRIKYIAKYQKGAKKKLVTGFIRVPKDLPNQFSRDQLTAWIADRHNISSSTIDITLKNYISKALDYGNTT